MLYEEIAEKTKATLDKLYKSRTKEEWDNLISGELKEQSELVKQHVPGNYANWHNWVKSRTDKMREYKKPYWEKQANRPQYQRKEVYLLRPETEVKLQQLLDVLITKFNKQ